MVEIAVFRYTFLTLNFDRVMCLFPSVCCTHVQLNPTVKCLPISITFQTENTSKFRMDYTTPSPCDAEPNLSNNCGVYITSHNSSLNTSHNGDTSSTSINTTVSSSSSPTSDMYEGLAAYALGYWYVHPYLSLLICVFGISSNIINIIILTQKKMLNPINCVLTGIAVSDIITMADYVPFVIHFYLRTGLGK